MVGTVGPPVGLPFEPKTQPLARTHRSRGNSAHIPAGRHPAGMAAADIGLRRLSSQRIVASRRCEQAADVVRWLGAVQAQDYHQSLWAIGARLRSGSVEGVERAIAERRILRTWLMRGT